MSDREAIKAYIFDNKVILTQRIRDVLSEIESMGESTFDNNVNCLIGDEPHSGSEGENMAAANKINIICKLGELVRDLGLEMTVSMQGKRYLVEICGHHPETKLFFKEYEVKETLLDALVGVYWGLINFSGVSDWLKERPNVA